MVVQVKSIGLFGMNSFDVTVETDISRGLPAFDIGGLPDASIKESRDRVRSAVRNCGFEFPAKRIVVNLAPADVKKYGSIYDSPFSFQYFSLSEPSETILTTVLLSVKFPFRAMSVP